MPSWKNMELVSGKPGLAKSVILPTCGCQYDSCYMCSYKSDCPSETPKNILDIFLSEKEEGIDKLKIFTSGSFFDKRELTLEQQMGIIRSAAEWGVSEITVESRPEFIDGDVLGKMIGGLSGNTNLEVAIGLESANNDVLRYHINKGFTYERFLEKTALLRDIGALVKTYLLLKPPFISEYESILDVISSAKKVEGVSDTISINPVSIHRNSVVERLWTRNSYRPPYLWSLVECLNALCDLEPYVMSHPVGVGKERGIHNCGNCEKGIMEKIESYNMGDRKEISYDCPCRSDWEEELKRIF